MDQIDLSLRLEHVFDIRINFDRRWSTEPIHRDGPRFAYTSVGAGSTVSGPRLQGKLVDHSGADWPMIRTDGVVELNAHYMIEADDGALIYIRNLGYVHGMLERPGHDPVPPYFRCTPYFRAPDGPHEWLNRTVIIGKGVRRPAAEGSAEPDHSLFRYYAVR
ncbi:DUF3237 domain-containing protein [Novosphingobium cyanobacteriorum]|uniref:UPF0311 protein POM99_10890 n=1 Tax=Novosphingobium cyanobacteriorum TaxID=3024215 RepID=A0ABT6CMZ9_9SPHN|nr:DUF3237 domain-containing protein [Novosphingobium cyanobacteriorum]MDF8333707.1 DUF3237 domain-containing protein [Novosphingobium cyanobacteriorum]